MSGPQFPLYIPSKGRHDSRLTVKTLDAMGVPYHVIVERQQFDEYASVIDPAKLLVLPTSYQDEYDTFDGLGATKSRGPGPARNFAWAHSVAAGAAWHWVMDDNINGFYRFNRNLKVPTTSGAIFRAMEDFCLRYRNIAMAGPQYHMFVSRKNRRPAFVANTRIYSCNLIRNDAPFRWRGRYNEDTDLSLRMLKAGWCTVQFNAFLQYKVTTQLLAGGNTAEFYAKEGTSEKSQMLVDMHPDVARLAHRFGRDHHFVDYKPFRRNRLLLKDGLTLPERTNDYGMRLVILDRA